VGKRPQESFADQLRIHSYLGPILAERRCTVWSVAIVDPDDAAGKNSAYFRLRRARYAKPQYEVNGALVRVIADACPNETDNC